MNKKRIKNIFVLLISILFLNISNIYASSVELVEPMIDYYGPTLYISPIIQCIMLVVFTILYKKGKTKYKIINIIGFIGGASISMMLINDNTYGYKAYITSIWRINYLYYYKFDFNNKSCYKSYKKGEK